MQTLMCVVVILAVGAAIVLSMWMSSQRAAGVAEAKAAYETALSALRADPGSIRKREAALSAGRRYVDLARQQTGRTLFDEVALSNDLAAIAAPAAPAPSAPSASPAGVEGRLQQIKTLRDKGLITDEEYAARREKILSET